MPDLRKAGSCWMCGSTSSDVVHILQFSQGGK